MEEINGITVHANKTYNLDVVSAKYLLVKIDWDLSKLKSKTTNIVLTTNESNQQMFPLPKILVSEFKIYRKGYCHICFHYENVLVTSCNHRLCNTCWIHYLKSKINSEQIYPVPCFYYKCNGLVSEEIINRTLKDNDDIKMKYKETEIKDFVKVSAFFYHCKTACPT